MDIGTLWLGVAGLIATVLVSAIGFYFTYKSQRSPLREALYARQIDALTSFVSVSTRIQELAGALMNEKEFTDEGLERAQLLWCELDGELLDTTQKVGLIMPSSVYSAMTAYRASVQDFHEALDKQAAPTDAFYALAGAAGHVFMVGRELVGADNLSIESVNLHSRDGYKKMQGIGREATAKVVRALWSRGNSDGKS